MLDTLEKERVKLRALVSHRAGFLFIMSALLWALSMVLAVYFSPTTTPLQGLALVALIVAAATGSLLSSYKSPRDLRQWMVFRTAVLAVVLMVGSVIYSSAMGLNTANSPYYAAPTPMGALGISGLGFLAAAVFGLAGFLVFYFVHGPSGHESIEEQILDE